MGEHPCTLWGGFSALGWWVLLEVGFPWRLWGETPGPGLVAGGGWGEAGAETEGWDVLGCEGLTAQISPRSAPTRTVTLSSV